MPSNTGQGGCIAQATVRKMRSSGSKGQGHKIT